MFAAFLECWERRGNMYCSRINRSHIAMRSASVACCTTDANLANKRHRANNCVVASKHKDIPILLGSLQQICG